MTLTETQIETHRCRIHGGYHFHAEAVADLIAEATQQARAEAKAEYSKALQKKAEGWGEVIDGHADDALQARAEAVAATTKYDDLRARIEAVVAPWPPGVRKGDVLRAIGATS